MDGSSLVNVISNNSKFINCSIKSTCLNNSKFYKCDMSKSNFTNSNMDYISLLHCNMSGK